jgi:hypothetical protein
MLANYVEYVGLNTVMNEKEIEAIIEDIAESMVVDDMPKDLIKELEERTKGDGQNNSDPN